MYYREIGGEVAVATQALFTRTELGEVMPIVISYKEFSFLI